MLRAELWDCFTIEATYLPKTNICSTMLSLAAYMNSLRQYVFCQLLTHQSWPRLRHFYVKLYRLLIPTWKAGTTTVTVSYVSSQAADLIVRNMARLLTLYLVLLFTCDTNLVKVATHDLSVPVGNRSMGRICNMSLWRMALHKLVCLPDEFKWSQIFAANIIVLKVTHLCAEGSVFAASHCCRPVNVLYRCFTDDAVRNCVW